MANKKMSHDDKKRLISGIAVALVGCVSLGVVKSIPEKAEEAPAMVDGVYTESAQGIFSAVKVQLTVADGAIAECVIDASGETPELGGAAAEPLAASIVEKQSAEIDGVAGATMTSNAVKEAAAAAIARAAEGDTDPEASFIDGTYTASAQGIFSEVKVQIVVTDGLISECTIDASGETPELGGAAAPTLADEIVASQKADVDAVAGATMTSNAVQTAAAEVIARALTGDVDPEPTGLSDGSYTVQSTVADQTVDVMVTVAEGAITEVSVDDAKILQTISDAEQKAEELRAQLDAALAGAAETAEEPVEEAPAAAEPMTYTASAQGISSDVVVTATLTGTEITDVVIDVSGETPGIGAAAGESLTEQFLAAQSADIDGVAGATITSTAAKTAMAEILAEAAEAAPVRETEESAEEAPTAAEPMTYTASAQGISSAVVVTATLTGKEITDVVIDVSGETPGIGAAAGDSLTEQFLAAQSADIDGVAGATITSTAAKTAMAEILAEAASGDSEDAAEAEEGGLKDGTYTASSKGISSDVTVTLTVSGGKITEASVDVSGETPGIGKETAEPLMEQILAAQSAEIDGVSGATITSTAAKTALKACLDEAM